ncbi:MAG: hypothetical protein BGO49_24910 [Planctomycetales bacterium 71-10]|nr:MAG: hypothetical protein BGO49_24910 [Planctomycetales bacterium 71-10]
MRESEVELFTFRLASHLGMTVGQVEQGVSSSELTRWMGYWRIDARPDIYQAAALISYVIAACHGNKGRFDDFLIHIPVPETADQRQLRFIQGFKACPKSKG